MLPDILGLVLEDGIELIKDEYTYQVIKYFSSKKNVSTELIPERTRIVRVKEIKEKHLQLIVCVF